MIFLINTMYYFFLAGFFTAFLAAGLTAFLGPQEQHPPIVFVPSNEGRASRDGLIINKQY